MIFRPRRPAGYKAVALQSDAQSEAGKSAGMNHSDVLLYLEKK